MAKLSFFFMVICLVGALEQCSALNYYWQTYPQTQDVLNYPQLTPVAGLWQPDCDKEGGSSSSESSSSESSSSESSSESKESKEGESSNSEESKSSSEEEGSSSEEEKKGSKEEKEGSKEEKEGSQEEDSEEESGEKKEKKKKSKEYKFPPPSYSFPSRPYQQVVYSAPSSYSYLPFRSSYLLQQPVATSYPVKPSYQYVSVPTSPTVVNGYSSPYVSKVVASPLATKIVYSAPTVSYPTTSKVVVPGSRVYALPAFWSGALSYIKK